MWRISPHQTIGAFYHEGEIQMEMAEQWQFVTEELPGVVHKKT